MTRYAADVAELVAEPELASPGRGSIVSGSALASDSTT